jgi:hypothetical protein
MALAEVGRPDAVGPYPDPGEDPPVRVGPGSLFVATRCPGRGEVGLEVWSGDPGVPDGWQTVFDGQLITEGNGFDAGNMANAYHIAAPSGRYHVRVDVHLDNSAEADAVRFVFPENDDLTGNTILA